MAEVASVGGFVKQYSVVIDPRRLQALGIPLSQIRDAIRESNMDVGGRTVEVSETEFAVRGRGYINSPQDLEQIVVKNESGVPVLISAQAWHWVDPATRRELAHRALVPGGVLALFGHEYAFADPHVEAAVNAAYARHARQKSAIDISLLV